MKMTDLLHSRFAEFGDCGQCDIDFCYSDAKHYVVISINGVTQASPCFFCSDHFALFAQFLTWRSLDQAVRVEWNQVEQKFSEEKNKIKATLNG